MCLSNWVSNTIVSIGQLQPQIGAGQLVFLAAMTQVAKLTLAQGLGDTLVAVQQTQCHPAGVGHAPAMAGISAPAAIRILPIMRLARTRLRQNR